MTQLRLALAGICLAALAVPGPAPAQTSTQQETGWGLHTVGFDTLSGRVVVHLPDDLAAGDTISGTVVAEPSEGAAAGTGGALDLAGTALPAEGGAFRWVVPAGLGGGVALLRVLDREGGVVASASVPVRPSAPPPGTELSLPSLGQVGRPVTIHGPFDGDLATTAVTVGGQPSAVLAESPRSVVARLPLEVQGPAEIEVVEGAASSRGEIRVVGVGLAAPRLDLRRGQRTTLTVTVTGLQGLEEEVSVRVVNRSPSRVTMKGGDDQTIRIPPGEVKEGGHFTWSTALEGISPGGFQISAIVGDLDRPEDPQGSQAGGTSPSGGELPAQGPPGQPGPDPGAQPSPQTQPRAGGAQPGPPAKPGRQPAAPPGPGAGGGPEPPPVPGAQPAPQAGGGGAQPAPAPPPAPPPPSHPIEGPPDGKCCCPLSLALVPDFKEEILPLLGGFKVSDHVTHRGQIPWAGDEMVGRAENDSSGKPGWKNLTFKFQVVAEVTWVDGTARRSGADCSFTQEIQGIRDPGANPTWPDATDDFRDHGWDPDAPAGTVVRRRGQRREGLRQSFSDGGSVSYSWADPFQLHYDPNFDPKAPRYDPQDPNFDPDDPDSYPPFKKARFTWYIESGCQPADCQHREIEKLGTVTLSAYPGEEKVCKFEEGHQ